MRRPEARLGAPGARDRRVTLAALLALTLLAAAYTVLGVGMEMSALETTFGGSAMATAGAMLMAPPEWTPAHALAVFLMWWIMMIAMMLPSAMPVMLLYAALRRRLGRSSQAPVAGFAGGYLAGWAAFALVATAAQWALEREGLLPPAMMTLGSRLLGGAVLVAAGLWQLSPAKHACLRLCRDPARVLAGRLGGGAGAAFRVGLWHGAWCVGCCWALMALLFVGGIMNLYWIAGLALIVLVEKLWARGEAFARAVGLALLGWGGWLIAGAWPA